MSQAVANPARGRWGDLIVNAGCSVSLRLSASRAAGFINKNGRFRRILPVPGRAREGLLTEPTADALLGILDCAVHIAFNPVTMFKITQAGRTSS